MGRAFLHRALVLSSLLLLASGEIFFEERFDGTVPALWLILFSVWLIGELDSVSAVVLEVRFDGTGTVPDQFGFRLCYPLVWFGVTVTSYC
jgi:hypothetical protein